MEDLLAHLDARARVAGGAAMASISESYPYHQGWHAIHERDLPSHRKTRGSEWVAAVNTAHLQRTQQLMSENV